jgi:Domain of unknown function (DUF5916)/Carbohydrate family 9 binding domain-like
MRQLLFLSLSLLLFCQVGFAQESTIKAFKSNQSPVMDGRLNDAAWNNAIPFSYFRMVEPTPGIDPTEKTEVRIIYDHNNLYIGIRCFDSEPRKITANTMEHDKSEERTEDQVSILLDPFQDKRNAYIFIVNSKGARSEGFAAGQTYSLAWDGIWEAKSRTDSEGWTTEIRIPFKTISFNPHLTSWGINIERYVARKQEVIRYSGIALNSFFSNATEAGTLVGIDSIKQGLGLTFRPYGITGIDANRTDTGSVSSKLDGGFDIYKNITPNLVAAFTYNTDFAETEVDERKLNLTRFPLFYPEKRTFFLEGSDIFDFGGSSSESFIPFFSRRIGLNDSTPVPIQFGTKVFGKVGNTNLSALDVQTHFPGLTSTQNMFAGRISQNILEESKVGIIATNGSQSGAKNTLFGGDFTYKTSRFMGSNNFSAGLWGVQNWNESKGGNKSAYGVKIDYPNDKFEGSIEYWFFGDSINPGLGFLPRQAYRYLYTGFSYMPRPEKGWIGAVVRQWFFEFRVSNYWNLHGELESRRIFTAPINLRTESGEHIEFNVIPNREVLPENFEVAEGVVIPKGDYSFLSYRAELNTASYRKTQLDLSYNFGGFYGGHYDNLVAGVTLKMDGYANLQLGANFVRVDLPQGKFSENIYSTKLNLYLTPDLGLSNYLQYDDVTNNMGYSGRFFWQIRPGNIIYLVYNNNLERQWNTDSRFKMTEEQIKLKIQLSIRF